MHKTEGIIYKATCLINNKIYIGKTVYSLNKRKANHILMSKKPKTYFNKAISKYGPDNFTWEILEVNDRDKLSERERYWINLLESFGTNGYNLTLGGEGSLGWKPSEETKRKIGLANKGEKNGWFGKKHTQEEKEKIRQSNRIWWESAPLEKIKERSRAVSEGSKGKVLSPEHLDKIRLYHKNNHPPNYGIPMSREQREKISNIRKIRGLSKGVKNPMFGKKHNQRTIDKIRYKALQRVMLKNDKGQFVSNLIRSPDLIINTELKKIGMQYT